MKLTCLPAVILAAATLLGCNQPPPPPPAADSLDTPEIEFNPAHQALLNFARTTVIRKIQKEPQFSREAVSTKSGTTTACGRVTSSARVATGYYLAQAGDVKFSNEDEYPRGWEIYCELAE